MGVEFGISPLFKKLYIYILVSLKGTATLMISMFYQKELYEL